MGILFIDTSSAKTEFGYLRDSDFVISQSPDSGYSADNLVYFIKESFDKNKISFKEIDLVSLSNGPGSFTGLRIGSAIAKGICYATGCRLIEMSTLDIIANKHKTCKKIISLVYSNSKLQEFYFCEYIYLSEKLKRLSDYRTGFLNDIIKEDLEFVINENDNGNIPVIYREKLIDVSDKSGIISMSELTSDYIKENKFSDYKTSEPFYMKEFIPK